jgi:YD repeat-containing protein
METNGAYDGDRFEYDDANRITRYYPSGTEEVSEYHFDENENVILTQNAQGNTQRFEYNEQNKKEAEIDANGNRTEYTYDSKGNIVSIRLADGSSTTYSYTYDGWLESITNPTGQRWDYTHDATGNITTVIDPAGGIGQYEYNTHGKLTAIIDTRGSREERTYDAHNRLVKISDAMANTTRLERDIFGRVTTVTDPHGAQTHYDYREQAGKSLYQASRIQFADNTDVNYQYNSEGLLSTPTPMANKLNTSTLPLICSPILPTL